MNKRVIRCGGWGLGGGLTVRQGGLLHRVTEGSGHIHSVGLHRQLVAGERLQRPEEDLLSRAGGAHTECYRGDHGHSQEVGLGGTEQS